MPVKLSPLLTDIVTQEDAYLPPPRVIRRGLLETSPYLRGTCPVTAQGAWEIRATLSLFEATWASTAFYEKHPALGASIASNEIAEYLQLFTETLRVADV